LLEKLRIGAVTVALCLNVMLAGCGVGPSLAGGAAGGRRVARSSLSLLTHWPIFADRRARLLQRRNWLRRTSRRPIAYTRSAGRSLVNPDERIPGTICFPLRRRIGKPSGNLTRPVGWVRVSIRERQNLQRVW